MAYPMRNDNINGDVVEMLIDRGLEDLPDILTVLINQTMKVMRERHLQATPYERTEDRKGYANGYKPKKLKTRLGELSLKVPQTRDTGFYPGFLTQGLRSERALKMAIAEMYFQGVSTRKVSAIMEELCGFEVTSSEVSDAAKLLDEKLEQWRTRKLETYRYVYLDAIYEKIRYEGIVQSCAVFVAIGVNLDGRREVLGLSVSLSEQEVHWRNFLTELQERGLKGTELLISDKHAGLMAARQAIFPSIPWQRCHFHLQQNAQAYVKSQSEKSVVADRIRQILTAPSKAEAERLLKIAVKDYEKSMPQLADWMEENIPEGLTYYKFPKEHHKKIRTNNPLERLNKEIRRRTKVVGIFPNEASCERLISAVLVEIHDAWITADKRYLVF